MPFKYMLLIPLAAFYAIVVFAQPAYAYLDPGTGSMIIQIIIGSIVAAAAAGRFYWSKIKSFFSGNKEKTDEKSD